MKRDLILFFEDILEAIKDIQESVENVSKEEFLENKNIKDANIRRLEIIGEAVKNIPYSFREKHRDISWSKIAGMRDMIIHGYFMVDLDAVWNVIKKDLPELRKRVQKIKEDLN